LGKTACESTGNLLEYARWIVVPKWFYFMEGQHMSRVASPSTARPANQVKVPHEKICMRAYEKWVQRGQPPGTHLQDWLEAERELQVEVAKMAGTTASRR